MNIHDICATFIYCVTCLMESQSHNVFYLLADGINLRYIAIRVGMSTKPPTMTGSENPLCRYRTTPLKRGTTDWFQCNQVVVGRYVTIQSNYRPGSPVVLCEVEVYSDGEHTEICI